jgi:hypothetical protein
MTKRITSCLAGLTGTLLVAALGGSAALPFVSSAADSPTHAQVRLVAKPMEGTDNTGGGSSNGKNMGKKDKKDDSSEGGMSKPDRDSNSESDDSSGKACDRGYMLMTIDSMLRSVAAPGSAKEIKAEDVNRDNQLCVELAPDGLSMTRYVDNNRKA